MALKKHPGILLISQADAPLALAHELLEDFYVKMGKREFAPPDNPDMLKTLNGVYAALEAWRTFLLDQTSRQLDPAERDPLGLNPWPFPDDLAVLKARLADPEDPLAYLSDAHILSSILIKVIVQAYIRLQSLKSPAAAEAQILAPTHDFAHHLKHWHDAMRTYKTRLHQQPYPPAGVAG